MPWSRAKDQSDQDQTQSPPSAAVTTPAATGAFVTGQPQVTAQPPAAASPIQQVSPAPIRATSADQGYALNELTFEVKKLAAELKHLRNQVDELQAKNQMWMNPLALYDKEIITDNGASIFGKIIYQDDKIVKVETLIGYLVLERKSIVRIITNIPQKPSEQYVPQELATDLKPQTVPPVPQVQPAYISGAQQPSQMTETAVRNANCVLVGNIQESKDRSGNTIFAGEVKNIGTRRADFVKINFIFRKNWSGDTKTKTVFVEGSYYTYESSGITSNNSLLPGATGTFKLIIEKAFGSFVGYSYTIEWEQY